MTRPDELRSDPVSIRDVLLGDRFVGPGLLVQVERQVLEQDTVEGPQYRTGSVIPTGVSAHKDHGSEDGFSDECLGLLCRLTEWLDGGIRNASETERKILPVLREHKRTDVQALTGKFGTIQQVRNELKSILPVTDERVPESVAARATELVDYLLGWLGVECDHHWQEVDSEVPRLRIFECSHPACGLRSFLDHKGRWSA